MRRRSSSGPGPDKSPCPEGAGPLVVLVDDDPRLLALMASEVARAARRPIALETFTEGERALRRLRDARPALVLLDLDLRGLSGLEVLAAIRRRSLVHRVVIVTVHSAATHRATCEALGADGFVEKGRLIDELPALLERLLVDGSKSAEPPTAPGEATEAHGGQKSRRMGDCPDVDAPASVVPRKR